IDPASPSTKAPGAVFINKQNGVSVGGDPQFTNGQLQAVTSDLVLSCLDDVRVSGHVLPLASMPTGSEDGQWAQVTAAEHVINGCISPYSCTNTTCESPLTCNSAWGNPSCSCGPGQQLSLSVGVEDVRECIDVDECMLESPPCIHGGICQNLNPGYYCICAAGYTGMNCQWSLIQPHNTQKSTHSAMLLAAIALFLIVLVLLIVLYIHFHQRKLCCKNYRQTEENTKQIKQEKVDDENNFEIVDVRCIKLKSERKNSKGNVVSKITISNTVFQDDVRAYSYEGENSAAGSSLSTISGYCLEISQESKVKPIVPELCSVMDLLHDLPDATLLHPSSQSGLHKNSTDTEIHENMQSTVIECTK
ncbi:unnamed protein product, partial [Meganyctiphanes norvegica]